jgi:hypothetical protein
MVCSRRHSAGFGDRIVATDQDAAPLHAAGGDMAVKKLSSPGPMISRRS